MLDMYGVKVRYDVIKKKLGIILPGHTWNGDNVDNISITIIISLATLNGLSTSKIPAYIDAIADQNLYNPVADWIMSQPWDGIDRLPQLYETITTQEGFPAYFKEIILKRWMISAVAAVLKPSGFKARGVLTFQGPQGIGKTSFLSSLIDDPILRESVIKLDHHMDGSNKDSILGAISNWLVEIGELDSSFKKDIARLKGFLTSDFDKIRKPYAMTANEFPRRTVFFASVNQQDFLVDSTGNSRWWTIPVVKINYQHGIEMQQLWAQLAVKFQNGEQWWLTQPEEDLLDIHNREHLCISVIREKLMDFIDMEQKGNHGNPKMTATEVLKMIGYDKPTNPQARECGGILRSLLGDSKRIKGKDCWRIPVKIETSISLKKDDDY